MCEMPSTIRVKSVIAGEYTSPPARGHLALGVLPLDRAPRALLRLVTAPLQVGDLACRGVQVDGGRGLLRSFWLVRGGFWLAWRFAGHAPQGSGRRDHYRPAAGHTGARDLPHYAGDSE